MRYKHVRLFFRLRTGQSPPAMPVPYTDTRRSAAP
nr:MAG TPA: hypothetical protein [Caudoviricetes sp.]DAU31935.1 MAG TPA: hypothetical protein [Caudoviricetes sp.]